LTDTIWPLPSIIEFALQKTVYCLPDSMKRRYLSRDQAQRIFMRRTLLVAKSKQSCAKQAAGQCG
jgi:hypothetical protein